MNDPIVGALGTETYNCSRHNLSKCHSDHFLMSKLSSDHLADFPHWVLPLPIVISPPDYYFKSGDNFGCMEQLQKQYKEFLYTLHPTFPYGIILHNH